MAKSENKRRAKIKGASQIVAGLRSWPGPSKLNRSPHATKAAKHT